MRAPAGPYLKRPLRFLELWEFDGWTIKLYGIRLHGEQPDDDLLEIAKGIAGDVLPQPAVTEICYGLAFVTVHQGEGFNQINIDWWEDRNELRHHFFVAQGEESREFVEMTVSGRAFCVWDLRVIGFERDAWVTHVLDNPRGADIQAYLDARLDEIA